MKKKKLLTASVLTMCAVLLVVGSVLTTMALLTATSKVSNTFTVGNVSITMDETKVTPDGKPAIPDEKTDANSYHLVPGQTYKKDPTIHIESGEMDEMLLFVKSRNEIRTIEDGNNGGSKPSMREQMIENGWVEFIRSEDGVEIVWVYGTREVLSGKITPEVVSSTDTQYKKGNINAVTGIPGDFRLCEEFTVSAGAGVSLYGGASVSFTAFAIQADIEDKEGHELTKAAWEAIKSAIPYETGISNPKNPYSIDNSVGAYDPVEGVEGPVDLPTLTP